MAHSGPYKLLTVNNAPERATRLISLALNTLKDKHTIIHAANAESPEAAPPLIEAIIPDLVLTASMWTPEQSAGVVEETRRVNPAVRTLSLPEGFQVREGPQAVVRLLVEEIPTLF